MVRMVVHRWWWQQTMTTNNDNSRRSLSCSSNEPKNVIFVFRVDIFFFFERYQHRSISNVVAYDKDCGLKITNESCSMEVKTAFKVTSQSCNVAWVDSAKIKGEFHIAWSCIDRYYTKLNCKIDLELELLTRQSQG